jgi:hypothetical protein
MRRTTIAVVAISAAVASGCGGGKQFANKPRPATPVNLTVYINNRVVSVSPQRVDAGPVVFIVTNQSSSAQSLRILQSGGSVGKPVAETGPISPQATAEVTVDFTSPGDYTIATGTIARSEAAQATRVSIKAASLHIGAPRPSASNEPLEP